MNEILDIITIIGAFAAAIAAIFSFVMWRITRNQELSRLMALYQHLEFIRESAEGHQNHVRNNAVTPSNPLTPFPSWPVANMDLNFYLTHINYKVRRKGTICCYDPTRKLKRKLIAAYEKIKNINYLWNLRITQPTRPTNFSANTYYPELYGFIGDCKEEIERLVK